LPVLKMAKDPSRRRQRLAISVEREAGSRDVKPQPPGAAESLALTPTERDLRYYH
jgi:hypothetical protein